MYVDVRDSIFTIGICDGLGVSWYAAKSIYEFRSPFYTNRQMRYELGPVIYLGWLSCLVSKLNLNPNQTGLF